MSKKSISKKIGLIKPERTLSFFIINVIVNSLVAIIIWPLLDMLLLKLYGMEFSYSVEEHVLKPIGFMLVIVIVEFATWNVWHKDGKKAKKEVKKETEKESKKSDEK